MWTLRRGVLGLGGLGFLGLAGAEAVSGHGAAWAVAEALLIVVTVWTAAGRPDRLAHDVRTGRRDPR